ncbi:AAA family ATPase, partial [Aliivibrio sp. S2MY1]|uniref:AAA family ATPase n=2 Tax=unclassified Aliivibrio TaxID=2645654 RepID=UPI002377FB08
ATTLPLIDLLESMLFKNLAIISSKSKNPAISVELDNTDKRCTPINKLATQINETVSAIEDKANKVSEIKANIKTRMWNALKYQSQDILLLEKQANEQISKEMAVLDARLSRIKLIGQTVRNKINDLRLQTSNIDETIDRINDNLKYLGVTGFEIVKSNAPENNNFFMLSRGSNSSKEIFKSLSEGEKTLITFLYYIEQCNGSMSKDSEIPDSEKIIVIDDPISSLSQNYIYDIASLIQSKVIKGNRFKKVIILTHSLFFYHELLKLAPRNLDKFQAKYGLYLVSKNEYSQVSTLEPKELKNDYQSLWYILKDVVNSKTDPIILPNIMRNILEYYFGFVHRKDQLSDIINKLADNEPNQGFKSFYRYINRESHSDPTNIGFMMRVQPQIYLDRFRSVFVASDDVAHYECMMQ